MTSFDDHSKNMVRPKLVTVSHPL